MKNTFTISLWIFVIIQTKYSNAENKNKTGEVLSILSDCKGDSCSVLDMAADMHKKKTDKPYERLRRSGEQQSGSIIEEDEILPIEYMVEKVSEIKTKDIITVAKQAKKTIKRLTKTGRKNVSQALKFNAATAQTLGRTSDPMTIKAHVTRLVQQTIQLSIRVAAEVFNSLSNLILRGGRNINDMIMIYGVNIDDYGKKQTEKIRMMTIMGDKNKAKHEAYKVGYKLSSISKACEKNIRKLLSVVDYNVKKSVGIGTIRIADLGELSECLLKEIAKHFPSLFHNLLLDENDKSVIVGLTNHWSRDLQEVVDEFYEHLADPLNGGSQMVHELTENRIAAVTASAEDDLEKAKSADENCKRILAEIEAYTGKNYKELEEEHIKNSWSDFMSKVNHRITTDLRPLQIRLPGLKIEL